MAVSDSRFRIAFTLVALAAGLHVCAPAASVQLHGHSEWVKQVRRQVRLRDIDHDKNLDIVIRKRKNGAVTSVWLNRGQARYEPAQLLLDNPPDGDEREIGRAHETASVKSRRTRARAVAWGMSAGIGAHAVCLVSTELEGFPEGKYAVGTRLRACQRGPPRS